MSIIHDMGLCSVAIDQQDDKVLITVSGQVTETFKHESVTFPHSGHYVFDLKNLEAFNSCGVREWVFFLKKFSNDCQLEFTNCSVSLMDQINMIPATKAHAKIVSFYAPYYCGSCDKDHADILIPVQKNYQNILRLEAPKHTCEQCSNPLEFDALEEAYFANFISDQNLEGAG